MRVRYKCSFWIGETSTTTAFDDVRATCKSWADQGSARPQSRVEELVEADAWGLLFRHPDDGEEGLEWSTELALQRVGKRVAFTCANSLGATDGVFTPAHRTPSRPRIVRDLLNTFGGFHGLPLSAQPEVLLDTHQATNAFLAKLTTVERTRPLVYVSAAAETDRPHIDVRKLADSLAGLAHVWVEENRFPSRKLGSAGLPDHLRCWNGAVRIYWPRFNTHDDPASHEYWSPFEVLRAGPRFQLQLLQRIANVSVYARDEQEVRWTDLQDRARGRTIAELRARGDDKQLLEYAVTENTRLAAALKEATESLLRVSESESIAHQQAKYWRQQYEEHVNASSRTLVAVETPSHFDDVRAVVEYAKTRFADRLVFALNGRSEHKDCEYEEPSELYDALTFLATDYWNARVEGHVLNYDVELRNKCGWFFRQSSGETTMAKYADWYTTSFEKKTFELPLHVGRGSGKDGRRTIRVNFAWDAASQRVIIGFIGQHPRTDAT